MSKVKCFYHSSDFDGHCSGAIVKLYHPNAKMYPINYDDIFPWDEIEKDDIIYMVDFGLQPFSDMIKLNKMCDMLIWIDHHKTAIDNMKESGEKFYGIQRNGIGACALVWEYFKTKNKIPYCVELLAEYDVWNHSNPHTLSFQYGLRTFKDTHPIDENMYLWKKVFKSTYEFIDDTCDIGNIILDYEKQINKKVCEIQAFETYLQDYFAIAINRGISSSKMFDSVWNNEKYDLMISFYISNKNEWFVSLYTDKEGVNVGEITKSFGGGGHIRAAGFQCKELPFKFTYK